MAESRIKAPPVRKDGLQLEEHRAFQERFWVAERVAWLCFVVLLLAALLGLTGSGGPLSRSVRAVGGGTIDYPVILRWEAADEMVVRFAPSEAERTLTLSSDFAEALQIERIQPEPASSVAGPDGVVMSFDTEPGESAEVTFHLTPLQPGLPSFEARIGDGEATSFSMIVLP